jgi:hypothetical protein
MSDGGLITFNQWTPVDGCGDPVMLVPVSEAVVVSAVNEFAPLANIPAPTRPIAIIVNGRGFFPVGSPPSFSVEDNVVTWLSTIYSVSPGDDVVANYYYLVG